MCKHYCAHETEEFSWLIVVYLALACGGAPLIMMLKVGTGDFLRRA